MCSLETAPERRKINCPVEDKRQYNTYELYGRGFSGLNRTINQCSLIEPAITLIPTI
jgi:hypothetical protein